MNDLINREAAIDAIYKNHMNGKEGVKQDLENLYGSAVCFSETLQDAVESIEELPTVPAIPIPDNATNGDMIKTMFPKVVAKQHITSLSLTEVIRAGIDCDIYTSEDMFFTLWFPSDWWNSIYMRGDTE